jgi:hypothetical protein
MDLDAFLPFRDLPWLRGVLAWVVVALGVWVIGAVLAGVRRARIHLVVSTILLACLTAIHTGMLSQIFGHLNFFPRSLELHRGELRYVFAAVLTLAEAGIGFLYGVLSDRDPQRCNSERRFTVAPLRALLLGGVMALFEGSFYDLIGRDKGLSVFLDIPFEWVFFAWGVVLVMTLFGLSSVCYRALVEARMAYPAVAL